MNTKQIIDTYTDKGWVFKQVSWPTSWRSDSERGGVGGGGGGVEVAWYYTSPRMEGEQGLITDHFTEAHLLLEESSWMARRAKAFADAATRVEGMKR